MKVELVGERFGKLTVLQYAGYRKREHFWHCGCACGNLVSVRERSLVNSYTKSCGCLRRDCHLVHGQAIVVTDSGKRPTKTYTCWRNMLHRCYKPTATGYKNYGGRGIRVCKRWRVAFDNFYEDMGEIPPGASIERLDNNRGYSPGNCKWATRLEQAQNKRNNVLITYKNKTQNLNAWAQELGINYRTLRNRLLYHGWGIEQALTEPTRVLNKQIIYQGVSQNIAAWEHQLGFSDGTLRYRLKRGWSMERALTTPSHR